MKSLASCAALVVVLALCLPAWSAPPAAGWSQAADTTRPVGQISQAVATPSSGAQDVRAADDWCVSGAPGTTSSAVTVINWWGNYHNYEENNAGPVNPPAVLPTSFILRQYANNVTDPANPKPERLSITETECSMSASTTATARCIQSYVQSVKVAEGPPAEYVHIFKYKAIFPSPWSPTPGSTYWFSIQAKYDTDPSSLNPPPYMHWEWLNTPPADLLSAGVTSADNGETWTKAEYEPDPDPYAGKPFNFAFELNPLELSVTPARFAHNTPTRVKLVASIPPIDRNFAVYVIVTRLDKPNKPIVSLVPMGKVSKEAGLRVLNIPCVPLKGVVNVLARGTAETIPWGAEVTLFDNVVSFKSPRQFLIRIAFFDPQQPTRSENDAFLLSSTEVVVE